MTPLVLGIDPSMNATGWALLDPRGPALFAAGCIETFSRVPMGKGQALAHQHDDGKRSAFIARQLHDLIREVHATMRDKGAGALLAVGIEAPLTAQSANAAWAMGRAHTAAMAACEIATEGEIRPLTFSALAVKKHLTGRARGEDSKLAVRREMKRRLGPSAFERAFIRARLTTDKQQEAAFDASAVALCAALQPSVLAAIQNLAGAQALAQNERETTWK